MSDQSRLSIFLTRSWSRDWAILLLRLWLGSMMIYHGWGKVFGNIDKFTEGVAKMGFPMPEFFAWSAALSEFGGGLLLIFGLFTRPAAMFVGITMIVAGFVRHLDDPFGKKELSLTYLVLALVILIAGPGKAALDRLLFNRSATK
ncbi:MAG: DoxX family protein [Candidatus Kapaibacterium sp.]